MIHPVGEAAVGGGIEHSAQVLGRVAQQRRLQRLHFAGHGKRPFQKRTSRSLARALSLSLSLLSSISQSTLRPFDCCFLLPSLALVLFCTRSILHAQVVDMSQTFLLLLNGDPSGSITADSFAHCGLSLGSWEKVRGRRGEGPGA
jgi:hypothetical protein